MSSNQTNQSNPADQDRTHAAQEERTREQQGTTQAQQAQHRDTQPGTTATANLDNQQHQAAGQTSGQYQGQAPGQTSGQYQGQGRDNQEDDQDAETPLDYYETLGLRHNAYPRQIEEAYKRQSLRFHPQNYAGQDREANDTRFAHVSEAYQVLNDPDRRRQYDEYLKKNNDKFREYQDKHRKENQVSRRNWRDLHPLHYRHHPYSPFSELFGYRPLNPFDQFNHFLTHGLFDDDDLDFFGFGRNRDYHGYRHRNNRNDFFGDRELRDFHRGYGDLDHRHQQGQVGQLGQDRQQEGQTRQVQSQYGQDTNGQQFEISKSVVKHTKVENGVRTTVTETKTVHPDGRVDHLVKEETEDRFGNHKVRFLNALPDKKRNEITNHQNRQSSQGQGQSQGQNRTQHDQDTTGRNQARAA